MTTLTQRMNVVEENLQSIRLTLDTLLQNLLNPALMVPGTLRFGGNTMQLDNQGMQVASGGSSIVAIYGVDSLTANPSLLTEYTRLVHTVEANASETSLEALAESGTYTAGITLRATDSGATSVALTGQILANAVLSPAALTADVNDYAPTDLAQVSVLRLSSDASRTITGLGGGSSGRTLILTNIGANDIILSNENASSDAVRRFAIGADVTLGASESCILWYDNTSTRWRMIGRHN